MEPTAVAGDRKLRYAPLCGPSAILAAHPADDMSVETDDTTYLIEFKVDMPQDAALAQIKTKAYAPKYRAKDKKIVLIGIGFSSDEKNVTEFVWEKA